jgi:hypothetical protein
MGQASSAREHQTGGDDWRRRDRDPRRALQR